MATAWPGDLMNRGRQQHADLRRALVAEVRRLAKGLTHEPVPADVGAAFTRAKIESMVRGLFPKAEQETVLATLEQSVVYVTNETIEPILLTNMWDSSAWDLANLYLLAVGAELLGDEAPRIVGISEETTCYVSPDYFVDGDPDQQRSVDNLRAPKSIPGVDVERLPVPRARIVIVRSE